MQTLAYNVYLGGFLMRRKLKGQYFYCLTVLISQAIPHMISYVTCLRIPKKKLYGRSKKDEQEEWKSP